MKDGQRKLTIKTRQIGTDSKDKRSCRNNSEVAGLTFFRRPSNALGCCRELLQGFLVNQGQQQSFPPKHQTVASCSGRSIILNCSSVGYSVQETITKYTLHASSVFTHSSFGITSGESIKKPFLYKHPETQRVDVRLKGW